MNNNTPFTYDDHKRVIAQMENGELTPQTLQAHFEHAASFTWGLWVTLNDFKVAELDAINPGMRGKKQDKVESVAVGLLIEYGFPTGERSLMTNYTYGVIGLGRGGDGLKQKPNWNQMKVDALRERVGTITQDMLDDYAAKVAESQRQVEKALANPETPGEYVYKIKREGLASLTPVQLVTWDRHYYEANREKIEKERAEAAQIKQIDLGEGIGMELQKGYHTKKEVDTWEVKLTDRVERDVFTELREAAGKLGGYYSRYVGGFVFWEQADAEMFVSLQSADGTAEERQARIAQLKQERAAERLLDYADRHIDAAQYQLTRDRLTNTVRRVAMAQSAWSDARHLEAIARTVESVADAIDKGEAKSLQGLKWVTQIVTLYDALMDAHRTACREEHGRYVPDDDRRPVEIGDIAHTRYPKPFVNVGDLQSLVKHVKGRRGTRGLTQVVESVIKEAGHGTYWVNIQHPRTADIINELAGICRDDKTKKSLYQQLADHKRLVGLGIRNIFVLRHVLRDFYPHVHPEREADPIKAAELAIVGRKFDGFFPTPADVVNLMIQEADIEPGQSILEPSAGKGNIVDGIVDQFGDGVTVDCLEIQPALRDILGMKGYNLIGTDFTTHNGRADYDRVLMNPPFEDGQDMEHVTLAYGRVRDGGKVVAIMSTGWTFGNRKTQVAFREWVEAKGWWQKLPSGSFTESGTGVETVLVVLDK